MPLILAIDDLADSRELMTTLIHRYLPACETLTAENGRTGLAIARERQPDVILIDAVLPDINGFEVCRDLRMDPATRTCMILMVSGVMKDPDHRIDGLDSGADGYICKPFQTDEFIAEIKVLLRMKENEDRLRASEQNMEETLRKRTAELVDSEARFRSLFEQAPDALFVESEDGTVLDANPAAARLHRMTLDQLIGKKVYELVPEDHRETVRRDFPKLFSGELTRTEGTSKTLDGSSLPVDITTERIQYNGEDALLLQVRDISQTKRIEMALRQVAEGVSEATGFSFFYNLVQSLGEVLSMDHAFVGRYDPAVPDTIETLAYSRDGEIVDNITYELKHAPCENVIKQEFCSYPRDVQRKFPKDTIFVELGIESYMGIPLVDSRDETLGLLVVMGTHPIEDVDLAESMMRLFAERASGELERMKAVEDLWESEERYRSLTDDVMEQSTVGFLILDSRLEVVWLNRAIEEYMGVARETIIGRDVRDLVRGPFKAVMENPDVYEGTLLSHYEDQTFIREFPCRVIPQGSRQDRWLEHWSQPIRSGLYAGGRIEYYTDITPQKQLQDQLMQSQKMESIGRLAGGIAHDFNNLLTSILGFSHLIMDELPEGHPIGSSVAEIIQAGQRAEKLTRQLLVFGRKQITQVRPLSLNAVVANMDTLLRRTLGEDVELVTASLGEDIHKIRGDTGQVEQIIMNLAVNARDAMPQGGKLTIETSSVHLREGFTDRHPGLSPGRYIRLTVTDNGTGMPEEVLSHAFEPFYTTKEKGKGTGLGLAIVYSIIQQSKGAIEVDSRAGKGTTFRIYFPETTEDIPTVADESAGVLPQGEETILVVEDEDTVRHLTVRILKSLGYNVLQAQNGGEALILFEKQQEKVDLVLTDVIMPRIGGPELIERLNAIRNDFKVVYMSGFTEDSLDQHGLQQSEATLILKPYTRQILAQTVRATLNG